MDTSRPNVNHAPSATGTSPGGESDSLALAVSAIVIVVSVAVWGLALLGGVRVSNWLTPRPELAIHPTLAAQEPGAVLDVALAARGHEVFERSCAACHGSTGSGKQGLGKDLVRSDFVLARSDAELVAFVAKGREATDPLNTTKIAMPPRGGNALLTDEDLARAAVYMRGLQDPRRMPELPPLPPPPPIVVAAVTQDEKAEALAAAGGDAELAGYIASGKKIYASTCAACHGPAAKGLKGLGKDLTTSEFVRSSDEDTMLAFIKRGRGPSEPGNTTGIAMPPKGGNPAMTEDNMLDVIAYMRTLQPPKTKTDAGQPLPGK
ncbi:MAG: c-type cytochrome [Phycisphaerales bacterium]|nr:c-type cytochrome [Phycisphaerales bacterium]